MAGFGADPGWAVIEQGGLRKILPQARSQGGGGPQGVPGRTRGPGVRRLKDQPDVKWGSLGYSFTQLLANKLFFHILYTNTHRG